MLDQADINRALNTSDLPSLEDLGVTPEIIQVAEEIADGADTVGIEKPRLEALLRAVAYLLRTSPAECREHC